MKEIYLWPLLGGALALAAVVVLTVRVRRRSRGGAVMIEISRAIQLGAMAFLKREYFYLAGPTLLIFALLCSCEFWGARVWLGYKAGGAFLIGAVCAALAGMVGMSLATRANLRTTEAAREEGLDRALAVAIQGGAVMGLSMAGFALVGLGLVLLLDRTHVSILAAYALGIALIALFARCSGGIYAKSADISADLVGKIEADITQDDPRNAAVIADYVGDNLGDGVGHGSDLMESYVEAMIAVMILATAFRSEAAGSLTLIPLLLAPIGVAASIIAIACVRLLVRGNPQRGLILGIHLASGLTLLGAWLVIDRAIAFPPEGLRVTLDGELVYTKLNLFLALLIGFGAGVLVNFLSDFYTSLRFRPARRISEHAQAGPALTVLEGLRVGMRACAGTTLVLAGAVVLAYQQAGAYGIALVALGLLATVAITIAVHAYGPIADNAGGIAAMARLDRTVREMVDNLHAVSNATAAMGKGFATFSAAAVALALLAAFAHLTHMEPHQLARSGSRELSGFLLSAPRILVGLLLGGMVPYLFGSLIFRAIGITSFAIMGEVRRQLRDIPGIMEGKAHPDCERCSAMATRGALWGMLPAGGLALALPVAVGLLLGKEILAGLLVGTLITGLMTGIQMINAGGALDNAKLYIEEGQFGGRNSEAHRAALIGDTVGDPLKDALGPSMNVLIKMMCVVSLVIAPLLK